MEPKNYYLSFSVLITWEVKILEQQKDRKNWSQISAESPGKSAERFIYLFFSFSLFPSLLGLSFSSSLVNSRNWMNCSFFLLIGQKWTIIHFWKRNKDILTSLPDLKVIKNFQNYFSFNWSSFSCTSSFSITAILFHHNGAAVVQWLLKQRMVIVYRVFR